MIIALNVFPNQISCQLRFHHNLGHLLIHLIIPTIVKASSKEYSATMIVYPVAYAFLLLTLQDSRPVRGELLTPTIVTKGKETRDVESSIYPRELKKKGNEKAEELEDNTLPQLEQQELAGTPSPTEWPTYLPTITAAPQIVTPTIDTHGEYYILLTCIYS